MGALDSTVKQLILVKADTSDARAEVRKLRGEEKAAAKERLTELERTNRGIDDQIARWAKVGIAIGATVAAFKVAQNAAKAYLEDVRLESAAAGINIDKLQKATRGLVEQDRLLAFAGKTQAGVWKLNELEMQRVLQGAMALRKTMGVELEPTIDALTEAITKGSTRALKEFGIEAKDKEGALQALDKVVKQVGGNFAMAGDDMASAGVKAKDAIDNLMGALGRLVVALGPAINALANLVDGFTRGVDIIAGNNPHSAKVQTMLQIMQREAFAAGDQQAFMDAGGGTDEWREFRAAGRGQVLAEAAEMTRRLRNASIDQALADTDRKILESNIREVDMGVRWATNETVKALARQRAKASAKLASGGRARDLTETGDVLGGLGDLYGAQAGAFGDVGAALSGTFRDARAAGTVTLGQEDQSGLKRFREEMAGARQESAEWQAELAAAAAARKQSFLESIFGPLDQFNAYASAFGILQNAVSSAFDAWITGQQSIGEAVKAAIATGLQAVAVDMAIQSLKNTAYGVAALATGPIGGVSAGGFFQAAGLFAAGSAAAGLAAKSMHSAGWAGGSPGGGGGAASSGGAGRFLGSSDTGAGGGTNQVVVMLGSDFGMLTNIEQKTLLRSAIRVGLQGGRSTRRVRRGA